MFDLNKQPAYLLVSFDEVIKDPNLFILNNIRKNYLKQFEPFINFKKILNLSEEALQKELMIRDTKNVFEWLKLQDFDYEQNYDQFYNNFPTMYANSKNLAMVQAIKNLIKEDFVMKVYFYSKTYDKRKHFDIKSIFNSEKTEYVTGVYLDVFEKIKDINIIIDNDVQRVSPLISDKNNAYKIFLIGRYGYNFEVNSFNGLMLKDNVESLAHENNIEISMFNPIYLTDNHFRKG